jgi:hypothetical protein
MLGRACNAKQNKLKARKSGCHRNKNKARHVGRLHLHEHAAPTAAAVFPKNTASPLLSSNWPLCRWIEEWGPISSFVVLIMVATEFIYKICCGDPLPSFASKK